MSHALLELLQRARRSGDLIHAVEARHVPRSIDEAYAIATTLMASEGLVGGYKVGATSANGRRLLGLREPFYGRMLASRICRSPATLRLEGRAIAVEPEIGCEMGTSLPPRAWPYTRAEVAVAVRRLVPMLELNRPSYAQPFAVGGLCLVADNGVNSGAVLGVPGVVGLDSIRVTEVGVTLDGAPIARGVPCAAPDDPLASLTWLANALSAARLGLHAGDVVATGAMTAPIDVTREGTLLADFGQLGAVQVSFAL